MAGESILRIRPPVLSPNSAHLDASPRPLDSHPINVTDTSCSEAPNMPAERAHGLGAPWGELSSTTAGSVSGPPAGLGALHFWSW